MVSIVVTSKVSSNATNRDRQKQIGVGYLDPGNWATDLAAGSEFGYTLLYVILISNVMATILQYLCIKLGVVTGNDLAMACRKHFSYTVNIALYILCELAIIATDLAEVIGTAIALNLLFGLDLHWGVALTSLDVLVILSQWGSANLRRFEAAIAGLVGIVAFCFMYLLTVSQPAWDEVLLGFLPSTGVFHEDGQLYIAVSIIGATIMPHNLYLHSSIVRYRSHITSTELGGVAELPEQVVDLSVKIEQPMERMKLIPEALKYSNLDSIIALFGALLINSAILIVASASFHKSGDGTIAEIKEAYELLKKHLGPLAAYVFAFALFCAGQSSTITGTLAGQIVTEGFLGPTVKFSPTLQRLATRLLAIVPAMTAALVSGSSGMNDLLVASQVVLSLQLPFAIWPLIWITCGASDGSAMKVTFARREVDIEEDGESVDKSVVDFVNSPMLIVTAVVVATFITIFNLILLFQMIF
ncbi:Mn2+/Fe2 transporter, NRAMP family [Chytriomyces sp. MP71]|nr:Mn2+/Fe2 transporter, NRAMP family [Chytriomyces sp. MP71]